MNTKTDEGLYEKARKLFISKASIDEFAGWATPRQVDAVHRLLDTELANRERAKHDRPLRRARFPVVKGLDGYDFTNVRLPCVCSIESGPCERVDVFHVSGRFWSTSACGEKRTPARPAWTSFPS
ncbi:Transposase [Bifidobacterium longum subsp. longum]|nr:Transposase [Bifidobacterium longum subsp. longum]